MSQTSNAIRAQFPALRRTHRGFPVAYFDGPGGTQVPQSVVDAVSDYLGTITRTRIGTTPRATIPTKCSKSSACPRRLSRRRTTKSPSAPMRPRSPSMSHAPSPASSPPTMKSSLPTRPPRQRRPLASTRQRTRLHPPRRKNGHRHRGARLARLRTKSNSKTKLVAVGAASNALGTISDVSAPGAPRSSRRSTHFRRRRPLRTTSPGRRVALTATSWSAPPTSSTARISVRFWCRSGVLESLPSPKSSLHPITDQNGQKRDAQPRRHRRGHRGSRLFGLVSQRAIPPKTARQFDANDSRSLRRIHRAALERAAANSRRYALWARRRMPRVLRRLHSPWPVSHRAKWRDGLPRVAFSCRTATSMRRPLSSG